ncbi:MAG: PEP-CTERM sorting domain-containing protein [Akkermansia sp.]
MAAFLSTAVPLSHAAVEVITFGDTQSSLQSVTTDNIPTGSSVSHDAITLGSGDTVKLNIESWGAPPTLNGTLNPNASFPAKNLAWNAGLLEEIETALSVDVADLCKSFSAYPAKHDTEGGIQLNLSGTHKAGDTVDIFLLGHLTINDALPYNIGFTNGLNNASLFYAKWVTQNETFVGCIDTSKKQAGETGFLWLRIQGTLTNDCTVNIPLSYTLNNTTYQPYALGAVFYSYTPTPAPEPSTAMLTLLALMALALRRRRRLN